jgi:K+-sensing histidine kinase KdpD
MPFTLPDRSSRLAELIQVLQADRDAIAWPDRVDLAESLREYLDGQPGTEGVEIMRLLAEDPKPEVRHAVAHLLPLVADEDFPALHDKLKDDCDAFVQRTAARAHRAREKARRAAWRKPVGLDQITRELAEIEKRHGVPAARRASQLCSQSIETVVSAMVHDLGSIATAAKAVTTALAADDGSRQLQFAKRLEEIVDQFERTVADMAQFTEPLSAERRVEQLRPIVQEAHQAALVGLDADDHAEAVHFRIDVPASIRVRVARHLIVTALVNVIRNAYQAFLGMPEHSKPWEIQIRARETASRVEIAVCDNGPGFSPEAAEALSAPALGRRNKAKRHSTGYGLPNAMRQVAAHDGALEIDSKPRRGTVVRITLPREFRKV